ncbi:hypothetical protein WJX73_010763 [Symbiochloris irregularis]|uniref:Uncharacterized protein n=1 Tax=Symbiochloris irregularis TaxID=706552 RepID=A0AAW1P5E0_9CHLO
MASNPTKAKPCLQPIANPGSPEDDAQTMLNSAEDAVRTGQATRRLAHRVSREAYELVRQRLEVKGLCCKPAADGLWEVHLNRDNSFQHQSLCTKIGTLVHREMLASGIDADALLAAGSVTVDLEDGQGDLEPDACWYSVKPCAVKPTVILKVALMHETLAMLNATMHRWVKCPNVQVVLRIPWADFLGGQGNVPADCSKEHCELDMYFVRSTMQTAYRSL